MCDKPTSIDFSTIIASCVHDMKNSLSMVLGSLDDLMMRMETAESGDQKQLAKLRYEAKRVNSNLVEMLMLYRLGQGGYPLNLTEQRLGDYLQEVALEHAVQLAAEKIDLQITCDDSLIWFFDRDLIFSVINNVINNTIRYTQERIVLQVEQQQDWLVVSIEDDGDGYPETMLGESYDQLGELTPGHSGTGLGLFFAAQVAKVHLNQDRAGYIRLSNDSTLGGGRFELHLP